MTPTFVKEQELDNNSNCGSPQITDDIPSVLGSNTTTSILSHLNSANASVYVVGYDVNESLI